MSLASVFQTARSGMSAATSMVEAVSHNIANSQTSGYKASRPVYATQATSTHGRENPLRVGMGVQVVGYFTDYSQGPLVASRAANGWGDGGWGDASWIGRDESWLGRGLVELSNTDVGGNLVDLMLASNQFLANANVFDTSSGLLDELVHLGRRSN